ncbi:hypothetical protein ACKUB1_13740 [Methanospirillum stamsii]|nr:hypothetical protein [Methanospirillum stamsii]
MVQLIPLIILERFTDYLARITLGYGYSVPSKVRKAHLQELLDKIDSDEIYVSQIETSGWPLVVRPVSTTSPEWFCLCENEVQE